MWLVRFILQFLSNKRTWPYSKRKQMSSSLNALEIVKSCCALERIIKSSKTYHSEEHKVLIFTSNKVKKKVYIQNIGTETQLRTSLRKPMLMFWKMKCLQRRIVLLLMGLLFNLNQSRKRAELRCPPAFVKRRLHFCMLMIERRLKIGREIDQTLNTNKNNKRSKIMTKSSLASNKSWQILTFRLFMVYLLQKSQLEMFVTLCHHKRYIWNFIFDWEWRKIRTFGFGIREGDSLAYWK